MLDRFEHESPGSHHTSSFVRRCHYLSMACGTHSPALLTIAAGSVPLLQDSTLISGTMQRRIL